MRIERLSVTQFRNLTKQDVTFSPGVNLLIGENGQGKTNVLEAIQYFKFARSFRTARDVELIQFGADFCRAEVKCSFEAGDHETFEVAITPDSTKKVKVAGKELPKLSELVGRYPVVLFGPNDLTIVSGAPQERRRFIDMVGSMTDAKYIAAAREYKRVLGQRNAALKARSSDYEMNIWNERISVAGADLMTRRRALVDTLERELLAHGQELESPFAFDMSYDSALMRDAEMMAAGAENGDNIPSLADVFAVKLGSLEQEERRRMTTLAGPHRDDVTLKLNDTDLRKFGSQGQLRLFAILLKLAELTYLESELREPCVLLLDDVFSEFDRDIMKKLQHLLDGTRQVFITSPVELEWARSENAREYHVRTGEVAGD